jgi:hypothetical protein
VNCRLTLSMALDFGDSSAFTVHRGYFFIRLVFIECHDEYLATVIAHPFERICSTRACPLRIKTVSGTRSWEGRLARARACAREMGPSSAGPDEEPRDERGSARETGARCIFRTVLLTVPRICIRARARARVRAPRRSPVGQPRAPIAEQQQPMNSPPARSAIDQETRSDAPRWKVCVLRESNLLLVLLRSRCEMEDSSAF